MNPAERPARFPSSRSLAAALGVALLVPALTACSRGAATPPAQPPSKSPAAELDVQPDEVRQDRWQQPASPVDEQGARAAVSAFDQTAKPASVKAVTLAEGGASFAVTAADGRVFTVNAASGAVVRADRFAPASKPGKLPLSQADGVKYAADFVSAKFPGFADVQMDIVTYGSAEHSLVIRWAQRASSGALLPKWAVVGVDLETGRLYDYRAACFNTTLPTTAKVSEDQARERMGASLSGDGEIELVVAVGSDLRHRLVWRPLQTPAEDKPPAVAIDAMTGDDVSATLPRSNP